VAQGAGVQVRGRVHIPAAAATFDGAWILVRLEDVSLADAAALVVAEQVIRDISHATGRETTVPFVLRTTSALDPRAHYSVRAHVDLTHAGRVTIGDLVSAESYPVRVDRPPAHVDAPAVPGLDVPEIDVYVKTVR